MRIVIDLQGAQSPKSRSRGIGRYSLSFALALARNLGEHELVVTLSNLFPTTIEPLRASFDGLLSQDNIRVWAAPAKVDYARPENTWRRQAAEYIREAFLASLNPDVVHISSLFEGLEDDAVTGIASFAKNLSTSVTLYDLIPYLQRKPYLENPVVEKWYLGKLEQLKRADLWLSISESARREGLEHLGLPEDRVVNVSTAADEIFTTITISPETEQDLRHRYGLKLPFLLYTGGIDHRKNIERLIGAFAKLPGTIRRAYQLAIVCSISPETRLRLEKHAVRLGLRSNEVVFTDFVPEQDLVALYNLCRLFVFPSWHEGFGLPALEAMHCGAPVIGANTSSVPEVIGRNDALFDPFNEEAIAAKIAQVLTDDQFRAALISHGLEQARNFSWDASAKRAISAYESLHRAKNKKARGLIPPPNRPTLGYVSPLPPLRTGIADYSAELLPELARHYLVDVIVAQDNVSDPWIKDNCRIRTVAWFEQHGHEYDRVLYHFGNSPFHAHMFRLLDRLPGIVVIHDFFLGHVQQYLENTGLIPHAWLRELYQAHGYRAVLERNQREDAAEVVYEYPCNFSVLQQALGVITHSTYPISLAEQWYGPSFGKDWVRIPLLRVPANESDRTLARRSLKLPDKAFLVCSFGMLGPTKQNHRLLNAWFHSTMAGDPDCHLIFVGENPGGTYCAELLKVICGSANKERVHLAGWTDAETFQRYLLAADVAVQLRTRSRGETSAAVFDCMNYSLPTIINANGAMAELPEDAVWMLPDEFDDGMLVAALETLYSDPLRRQILGEKAAAVIREDHAPKVCADRYVEAIEKFYLKARQNRDSLVKEIARLEGPPRLDSPIVAVAQAIARNHPGHMGPRQLFVDISVLVQHDARSGIQRVVRSLLQSLISSASVHGFRLEPVFATLDQTGYRYARKFMLRFLGCPDEGFADDPVEVRSGDVFLGLDFAAHLVPRQVEVFSEWRNFGVRIFFVIYDLLPALRPDWFPEGTVACFLPWLKAQQEIGDGALCISHSVAKEAGELIKKYEPPSRRRPFRLGWFHLGADFANSVPSLGLPRNAQKIISQIKATPSFLMVGTLEPRKGHAQTLLAFEQLWAQGFAFNLIIVGNQGWKMDLLAETLRSHPENGRRLLWLEGVSDEYLRQIYAASTCLIAASEGEGFGLPLIEAAQHQLPIIARDIPVFREVGGDQVFYFHGRETQAMAEALKKWFLLFEAGRAPLSEKMPWLTWEQSAQNLLRKILEMSTL
jgi:glycosyltransferase involved in cell wall biosynthesis